MINVGRIKWDGENVYVRVYSRLYLKEGFLETVTSEMWMRGG